VHGHGCDGRNVIMRAGLINATESCHADLAVVG